MADRILEPDKVTPAWVEGELQLLADGLTPLSENYLTALLALRTRLTIADSVASIGKSLDRSRFLVSAALASAFPHADDCPGVLGDRPCRCGAIEQREVFCEINEAVFNDRATESAHANADSAK